MNSPAENILQELFETTSLQNVSAQQLLKIINEHPYNGTAYFLLAKKLYLSKETGYENAVQKAALYFSNDLWLHFNISEIEKELINNAVTPQTGAHTKNEIEQIHLTALITDEPINAEEKSVVGDTITIEDEIEAEDEEEIAEHNNETDNIINEKLSNILQQQAAAFEKTVEASAEIPVENTPYHRVDYFDSQGIKLEEEKTNDKLGTQLKRFTDWLKQMKRINPTAVELNNDEAGESKVQVTAEHSNEAEEIITETMAEVLIKQGKAEQAIQIYEKLSFNNTAKSAYFAAKIKELKG